MFHHSILNSNHAVAFPSTSFFQDGKFHAAIVKNNKKWVGGGG